MENFFQYLGYFGLIIGAIGSIGGAGLYLKYISTKSNLEGKDETIETLERSRDAYRDENIDLRSRVSKLEGEVNVWKSSAQQTPEIIDLTKNVAQLIKTVENGQKQLAKYFAKERK